MFLVCAFYSLLGRNHLWVAVILNHFYHFIPLDLKSSILIWITLYLCGYMPILEKPRCYTDHSLDYCNWKKYVFERNLHDMSYYLFWSKYCFSFNFYSMTNFRVCCVHMHAMQAGINLYNTDMHVEKYLFPAFSLAVHTACIGIEVERKVSRLKHFGWRIWKQFLEIHITSWLLIH